MVREEKRKREFRKKTLATLILTLVREEKRSWEEKLRMEVLERREEAKERLTKENIDRLVDFIKGNDKHMVTKKNKKKNVPKKENNTQ